MTIKEIKPYCFTHKNIRLAINKKTRDAYYTQAEDAVIFSVLRLLTLPLESMFASGIVTGIDTSLYNFYGRRKK